MSERCERTSERRSEWPSTPRVDFISFEPTVRELMILIGYSSTQSGDITESELPAQTFKFESRAEKDLKQIAKSITKILQVNYLSLIK